MNTHPKLTRHLFNLLSEYGWGMPDTTEMQQTNIQGNLDLKKGIDGFVKDPSGSYEPYSIRHQFKINYKSFTIRHKLACTGSFNTENKKITDANNNGGVKPTYTIQAYWDTKEGGLIGFGIIFTKDLYDFKEHNLELYLDNQKTANNEGNKFLFVKFSDLYNTQPIPQQVSMFGLEPPREMIKPDPLDRPMRIFIYETGKVDLNRLF